MKPLPVTNYYFEDENSEPVSIHVLPVQWGSDTYPNQDRKKKPCLHLRGEADNGLETVHKPVFSWRVDVLSVKPVISVLSEKDTWIVLQRPRKSFESIIKPVLVTLQCLSYLIRFPEASARSMWEYLAAVFSSYESKPSERDLVAHKSLIREAVKWEGALAKCKVILDLLSGKSTMSKLPDEDIRVRNEPRMCIDDLFEDVCVFCDNGGVVMCCEGRCLRSFHATKKDAGDHKCESLGFKPIKVDEVRKVDFYCKNCQHKQHQCYACGKLGSSDKYCGAEVFKCSLARCGQFYHPHCIAKYETGELDEDLEKRIKMGESFKCPIHKCYFCKQLEADTKDRELQFAVCRRCPTSYHRKCLPRDIQFAKGRNDEDKNIRAWEGLLSNRVLIYCTKHAIVKDLGTPIRDHVKFPDVNDKEIAAEEKASCQETKKNVKSQVQVAKKILSRRGPDKFPDVNDKKISAEKKKRRLTSESHADSEDSEKSRKRLSSEGLHKEETAPKPSLSQLIKDAKAAKKKLISAVVKSSSRESSSPPASIDSVAKSAKDRLDSAAVGLPSRESSIPPASLDCVATSVENRLDSAAVDPSLRESSRPLASLSYALKMRILEDLKKYRPDAIMNLRNSTSASLDSVATSVKDRLDSAAVDPSWRESSSPPVSLHSATNKRLDALVNLGTDAITKHRDSSTLASSERTDAEMHTAERYKEDSS